MPVSAQALLFSSCGFGFLGLSKSLVFGSQGEISLEFAQESSSAFSVIMSRYFLIGTLAHQVHLQNIARALYEAGVLGVYCTGAVDNYRSPWSRGLRRGLELFPGLTRLIERHRITEISDELIYRQWGREGFGSLLRLLGGSSLWVDRLWERSEHVLIFPTLCDGFGQVVMEAFSSGLPVITTANAGAAEFVREGENGFLIPPADPAAHVQGMEKCVQHPEELSQMRKEATVTARRWTWNDFRPSVRKQLGSALKLPLRAEPVSKGREAG